MFELIVSAGEEFSQGAVVGSDWSLLQPLGLS